MSDDDHLDSPEQLMREVDATEARWAREERAAKRRQSDRWIGVAGWLGIAAAAGVWLANRHVTAQLGWYGAGRIAAARAWAWSPRSPGCVRSFAR